MFDQDAIEFFFDPFGPAVHNIYTAASVNIYPLVPGFPKLIVDFDAIGKLSGYRLRYVNRNFLFNIHVKIKIRRLIRN